MNIFAKRRFSRTWLLGFLTILLVFSRGQAGYASTPPSPALFTDLSEAEPSLTEQHRKIIQHSSEMPITKRQRLVRVDVNQLKGGPLRLNLFPDRTWVVEVIETRMADSLSVWTAKIENIPSDLFITHRNGNIYGELLVNGEVYTLQGLGNGRAILAEIDPSKLPPEKCPQTPKSQQPAPSPITMGDEFDDGNEQRVMIAYTPTAANMIGTNLEDYSLFLIEQTNQVYLNSNIQTRLKLAYYTTVLYIEVGDIDIDLDFFLNPNDGVMDEIHNYRWESGTDMSVLITASADDGCGVAEEILAVPDTAFAVVVQSCVWKYTFVHELGHLQGARHDTYVDDNDDPFEYGHGYVNLVKQWRTIMAYNDQCELLGFSCTRIPYFSNPDVSFGGDPTGTEDVSNNARVLNETKYIVANFQGLLDTRTIQNYDHADEDVKAAKQELTIEGGNAVLESNTRTTFESDSVILKGEIRSEPGAEVLIHQGFGE